MKAEFLNPFIKSVSQVMESMLNETPVRGRPYVSEDKTLSGDSVAIIIGMNGALNGQIVLSLSEAAAKGMAARLLMEESIPELDEDAKSALAEIGNMVTANATIGLSEAGYSCDITPPAVMLGDNMQVYFPKCKKALIVPLQLSFGGIDLFLAIEETTTPAGEAR